MLGQQFAQLRCITVTNYKNCAEKKLGVNMLCLKTVS